jgi:hypothetical protein
LPSDAIPNIIILSAKEQSMTKNYVSSLRAKSTVALATAVLSSCLPLRNQGQDSELEANFELKTTRGRETKFFTSPSGQKEICVLPKPFPGVRYDNSDPSSEEELCSADFYKVPGDDRPGTAVALCPKMSSTFPGVELYDLKKLDKTKYETALCKDQDNRPTSRIAKFKQSISCSYTGSILGYYHLSRILGGAGMVPNAMVRTMDRSAHLKIAERGATWSTGLNATLWNQVKNMDLTSNFNDNFTTADNKQVYGALSDNPSNELRYAEINFNSQDGATAKARFLQTAPVRNVLNPATAGSIVARDFGKAAPVLQQMRDMGELILMDYIFQQQDRFGNIHSKFYWFWLNEEGKMERDKIKLDANEKPILSNKPNPNAAVVKKLLLKDNDCGSRAGHPKAFVLADLAQVRHMHPRTYKGIRYLAKQWQAGVAKPYFEKEALLNTPDTFGREGIAEFGKRVLAASDQLTANCKSGKLLLDLDITSHIKNTSEKNCDAMLEPTDTPATEEPRTPPAPPREAQIEIVGPTFIKKKLKDSSLLEEADKCFLSKGAKLQGFWENAGGGHLKVEINNFPTDLCPACFSDSTKTYYLFERHTKID